jgi:Na+-driven multidrug efflux pump
VLPVLLEQLLALSVGFVDKWLAGNLFSGAEPLAAVGLVAYCLAFLPVLFTLPTAAVTALVARHVGAGEPVAARRALAQCGLVAIAPTVAMAVLAAVWGSRLVESLGLPPESSLLAERYLAIVVPARPAMAVIWARPWRPMPPWRQKWSAGRRPAPPAPLPVCAATHPLMPFSTTPTNWKRFQ